MARQIINIGSSPNKGDGDALRVAFEKVNNNFDDLYNEFGLQRDITGVKFIGDDSTILINGASSSINLDGTVKGNIIPDANVAYDLGSATNRFRDLYLSGSTIDLGGTALSIVGGELRLGGVKVPTTTDLAGGSITVNATGDVQGSVFADDSTLLVDAVNHTMFAETLTTLAVFGNPSIAVNANTITIDARNGDLNLQSTDTITNTFVNSWEVNSINGASLALNDDGVTSSELAVNIDVVNFGTGNTIDMQNCSVLFTGATVDFTGATIDWASIVSSQIQANGLPVGTRFTHPVPATSEGASGDVQGAVTFDSNYIYYCTATYSEVAWANTATIDIAGGNGVDSGIAVTLDVAPSVGWSISDGTTTSTINQVVPQATWYVIFWDDPITFDIGDTVYYGATAPSQPDIWKRVAWSSDTW